MKKYEFVMNCIFMIRIICKIKYLDDDSRSKLPDFKTKPEPIIDNTDGTDRVLLGMNENGVPVYWSIGKNLQNRHMFIQGASGSGKTVLLLAIAILLTIAEVSSRLNPKAD